MSFQAATGDRDGFTSPPASTFLHSPHLVRLSAKQSYRELAFCRIAKEGSFAL